MLLTRRVLVKQIADGARYIILEDQIFLVETLEQLMAQPIHGLALLVHHVVVLKQVFA